MICAEVPPSMSVRWAPPFSAARICGAESCHAKLCSERPFLTKGERSLSPEKCNNQAGQKVPPPNGPFRRESRTFTAGGRGGESYDLPGLSSRAAARTWLATLARSSLVELRINDWIPPPPSPA